MAIVSLEKLKTGIAVLRVDRPEVRNALNWTAQYEFAARIEQALEDFEIRVLLITGAPPAFMSGGDIGELAQAGAPEDGLRLAMVMGDALMKLQAAAVISLAVINGAARGGGVEVALACNIRLMAAEASLALVHSRLGLAPGWGGGQALMDLVGRARAMELLASGRSLTAEEARALQLVDFVLPEKELLAGAMAYAEVLLDAGYESLASAGRRPANSRVLWQERGHFMRLWNTEERKRCFAKFGG